MSSFRYVTHFYSLIISISRYSRLLFYIFFYNLITLRVSYSSVLLFYFIFFRICSLCLFHYFPLIITLPPSIHTNLCLTSSIPNNPNLVHLCPFIISIIAYSINSKSQFLTIHCLTSIPLIHHRYL